MDGNSSTDKFIPMTSVSSGQGKEIGLHGNQLSY